MPGVTSAGLTTNVPFNGNVVVGLLFDRRLHARAVARPRRTAARKSSAATTSRRCRSRLIEGRFFNDGDTADSPPVVVVDQYLANKYFREAQRARPADSARRSRQPADDDCRRRRHDQQHRSRAAGHQGARLSPGHAAAAGRDGAGPQDRPRSADARQPGARGRPRDRSRTADRRRADDGSMGVAIARTAACPGRCCSRSLDRSRWSCRRSASTACSRSAWRSAAASSGSVRRSARTGRRS